MASPDLCGRQSDYFDAGKTPESPEVGVTRATDREVRAEELVESNLLDAKTMGDRCGAQVPEVDRPLDVFALPCRRVESNRSRSEVAAELGEERSPARGKNASDFDHQLDRACAVPSSDRKVGDDLIGEHEPVK